MLHFLILHDTIMIVSIIPGFDVNKVGDARVGFVGFPSVGKSTLLTKLTGTFSEVIIHYSNSGDNQTIAIALVC